MAGLSEKFDVPSRDQLRSFYRPLVWLYDHTPLQRPLQAYIEVWGAK